MMHVVRRAALAATLFSTLAQGARAELYDDLGGDAGVQRIVDRAIVRFMADPLVGPTFADSSIPRFRRLLTEKVCQVSGGPCHYSGRDMAAAHKGLDLTQGQFNAVVEDVQAALEESGVPFHTQNRLLAKLAPDQRDVVTR